MLKLACPCQNQQFTAVRLCSNKVSFSCSTHANTAIKLNILVFTLVLTLFLAKYRCFLLRCGCVVSP